MTTIDYPMTIDSDTEDSQQPDPLLDHDLDPHFTFDLASDNLTHLLGQQELLQDDVVRRGTKPEPISVDDIIARRRLSLKRKRGDGGKRTEDIDELDETNSEATTDDEADLSLDSHVSDAESEDGSPTSSENDRQTDYDDPRYSSDGSSSSDDSEGETQTEKDRKAAYFDSEPLHVEAHTSFLSMNISRPILKALTSLGFHKPTPIQAVALPVALLGKDVVGGAVTGSGKTAAFMIPMLERLIYREKGPKAAATRCLVLLPTRELAVQCFEVGTKLAAHTDIRFCLVVGGLSVKSQEVSLRSRPDILIATPGRLIDHIRNSPSFSLEALDILVLDEADRMLSDGFADELTEIIKACPLSRQTMLFSATMTDSVDELIKMSLNKPVRLFVDPKRSTARGLVQEFVRVRAGKEAERPALLVALCKRTFKERAIIFFRSKKLAHQLRVVFTLLGLKCDEMHGDLSQEQRLAALQQFRTGSVDFLMATDLASRGLDIKGVEVVINYDMPGQLAQYLHRVGRTARAGAQGRSVTLVGEADRKMLKTAIKHAAGADQVRHRIVPPESVSRWAEKLNDLREEISEILKEEKEEKGFRQAEMQLKKGQNMIEHEAEIHSRPARTWFQTEKEKLNSKAISKQQHNAMLNVKHGEQPSEKSVDKPKRDRYAGLSRKVKRRKLAEEDDNGNDGAIHAAIRSAKKAARPAKIGMPVKHETKSRKRKRGSNNDRFDTDLTQKTRLSEGVRAKKGDSIGMKKPGGRRKKK